MRKYVVIYRAVFIENLQYTANIMMGFITYLILSVVFLNLWGYMYDAPGELIAGYTKEQMIWYVMITEMIWFGARSSTVREQVAADIRGGNIAYLINKPYRYPFYILANIRGSGIFSYPCTRDLPQWSAARWWERFQTFIGVRLRR